MNGHGEDHAQQPAQQPMGPLPPIDALERGQAHAAIDQLVLGNLLIVGGTPPARPVCDRGGITPEIGFHSVIERPDPVRRVAPPTMTMHSTRKAVANSQYGHGPGSVGTQE